MGGLLAAAPTRLAQAEETITQPAEATAAAFAARALAMRALAERSGDQPYGALVVKDDTIVAEAPSRVVTRGDPTAHAEMEAIRDAARRLGTRNLSGMHLYGSSRACPMCRAAAYWAGIDRLYHGRKPSDDGPPTLC
jgi:tRNA(Arg) A34 adenosine deaminase TadA